MTTTTAKKTAASANGVEKTPLQMLLAKRNNKRTLKLYIEDEDGEKQEISLTFTSIGSKAYDKLVSKHPPTAEQRLDGATYNPDTFAPALVSVCMTDPEITEAQAKQLWTSETWSRGDLMAMFGTAVGVNNQGSDIPFTERD